MSKGIGYAPLVVVELEADLAEGHFAGITRIHVFTAPVIHSDGWALRCRGQVEEGRFSSSKWYFAIYAVSMTQNQQFPNSPQLLVLEV